MKTIITLFILSSTICYGAEKYRIVCPTCSATNVIGAASVEKTSEPLPDAGKEINRKSWTETRTFTCENCGNGIVSVKHYVSCQKIVDLKADPNATETYISSHPVIPTIKIK